MKKRKKTYWAFCQDGGKYSRCRFYDTLNRRFLVPWPQIQASVRNQCLTQGYTLGVLPYWWLAAIFDAKSQRCCLKEQQSPHKEVLSSMCCVVTQQKYHGHVWGKIFISKQTSHALCCKHSSPFNILLRWQGPKPHQLIVQDGFVK